MKPIRTWIIPVLGLALTFLAAPTAFAQPPLPDDEEYRNCVSCHRTTVSHPVVGWEDCRGCHDQWESKEIQIPNLADSYYDHGAHENEACVSCHPVATSFYEGVPPVACGVCHPKSTATETVHNGPDNWVDCVDCHQAAGSFPHDLERIHPRSEDCMACHREGYSLSNHIARGDPHVSVDCAACHLQDLGGPSQAIATAERNPITNRVQIALPEMEEGIPRDHPELAADGKEVNCQRCHISDNTVSAPAAELPPRSVLCLACHDASLVVQDGLSWAGIGIFGAGMLVAASVWLRGSIDGQQGLSLPARLSRIFVACLGIIATPRLFVLVWSFIVDGILHRKLFRKSKLHWLTHACMFLGMAARMALGVFTWLMALLAPTAPLTQILVNKSSPAVALVYDGLGLLVILGAVLAIVRRYVVKDKQLITGGQDTVAIALIGAIFLMGFVVEGARILTTDLQPSMAAFSFVGHPISAALGLVPANWGAVYGWLWYIHAGLVAALVAYLPFSKFIHVLIGPIVAAFNSALEWKRG